MKTPLVRCSLTLLLALLSTAPAQAGLYYRFVQEGTTGGVDDGEAWVEGEHARVDWRREKEPFTHDVTIDPTGDWVHLHTGLGTWYDHDSLPTDMPNQTWTLGESPSLSVLFGPMTPQFEVKAKKVEVALATKEKGAGEVILGVPTTEHVLEISYRLDQIFGGSVAFTSKVTATVHVWTTDALAARDLPVDPLAVVTGIETVDRAVARELAKVEGFPLRRTLRVRREVPDTPAEEGIHILTFEEVREEPVPESRFAVPEEYRKMAPQFASPGRG